MIHVVKDKPNGHVRLNLMMETINREKRGERKHVFHHVKQNMTITYFLDGHHAASFSFSSDLVKMW